MIPHYVWTHRTEKKITRMNQFDNCYLTLPVPAPETNVRPQTGSNGPRHIMAGFSP